MLDTHILPGTLLRLANTGSNMFRTHLLLQVILGFTNNRRLLRRQNQLQGITQRRSHQNFAHTDRLHRRLKPLHGRRRLINLIVTSAHLLSSLRQVFSARYSNLTLINSTLTHLFRYLNLNNHLNGTLSTIYLNRLLYHDTLTLNNISIIRKILGLNQRYSFNSRHQRRNRTMNNRLLKGNDISVLNSIVLLNGSLVRYMSKSKKTRNVNSRIARLISKLLRRMMTLMSTQVYQTNTRIMTRIMLDKSLGTSNRIILNLGISTGAIFRNTRTRHNNLTISRKRLRIRTHISSAVRLARTLSSRDILLLGSMTNIKGRRRRSSSKGRGTHGNDSSAKGRRNLSSSERALPLKCPSGRVIRGGGTPVTKDSFGR